MANANTTPVAAQVGRLTTSFRAFRPNPEADAFYAGYQSSVEDLLGIQEFAEELLAVKAGMDRARVIEETDTKNERVGLVELELDVVLSAGSAFLSWDSPCRALADAFAKVSA